MIRQTVEDASKVTSRGLFSRKRRITKTKNQEKKVILKRKIKVFFLLHLVSNTRKKNDRNEILRPNDDLTIYFALNVINEIDQSKLDCY